MGHFDEGIGRDGSSAQPQLQAGTPDLNNKGKKPPIHLRAHRSTTRARSQGNKETIGILDETRIKALIAKHRQRFNSKI